ncbi:MAG: hypothetical protein JEZ00_15490 [Anaerolineaceae bacterium]|nr:hypothetical protein [Anaerolineaceae bacterium]
MKPNQKNNPSIHHRRSIRLKAYDYSQVGAYFVTICTHEKECRFGDVVSGEMVLNELGKIAWNQWECLSERFPNIVMNEFVVMPNHMHGIIIINERDNTIPMVGAGFTPVQNGVSQYQSGVPLAGTPTVGDIVGAYKSLVFKECLALYKNQDRYLGRLWQRNYFERIIRNEKAHQKIVNYILTNPLKWEEDKYYHD